MSGISDSWYMRGSVDIAYTQMITKKVKHLKWYIDYIVILFPVMFCNAHIFFKRSNTLFTRMGLKRRSWNLMVPDLQRWTGWARVDCWEARGQMSAPPHHHITTSVSRAGSALLQRYSCKYHHCWCCCCNYSCYYCCCCYCCCCYYSYFCYYFCCCCCCCCCCYYYYYYY